MDEKIIQITSASAVYDANVTLYALTNHGRIFECYNGKWSNVKLPEYSVKEVDGADLLHYTDVKEYIL